jgi:sugar phosphate isomerase/epimerase
VTQSDGNSRLAVGINTMSWMWRAPAREALESMAREGYRRFEVMAQPPHFDPAMPIGEAREFGRFLRDAGLVVETLNLPSLDHNLASAAPAMREYSVRLFENLIGIAEAIGAAGLVVVTGRVNPLIAPPRRDVEGWFADSFARVLRAAERTGVRLLLENIPMGVYPRADQLADFAAQFDGPLVGICYDIANAHFIGEDAAEGVRRVRRHLAMVHLSDTRRDAWRHDPVGHGSCDFAGFATALAEVGYGGTSMLEIVAEDPVAQIMESHWRIVQWGWDCLPAKAPPLQRGG